MLGVGDGSAVYLALHPVDFRRGIAALSSYAREHLGVPPDSGVVLVFRSRRPGRVKVLSQPSSPSRPCRNGTGKKRKEKSRSQV